MPVPSAITDLSTTLASNSPAGSDNVFPDLDNYLRAHAQFVALLRDGRGLSTEVSLASAATCDIGGAASMFVQITGTTTITSFGTNYLPRILRFAGVLTLTHNATTLILPTGANITTAAGDTCLVVPVGTSGWRVLQYQRASDGSSLFLQAGTGAVNRTVQSKLRERINVRDFGAVLDGTTDDLAAFNAAIQSVASGAGVDIEVDGPAYLSGATTNSGRFPKFSFLAGGGVTTTPGGSIGSESSRLSWPIQWARRVPNGPTYEYSNNVPSTASGMSSVKHLFRNIVGSASISTANGYGIRNSYTSAAYGSGFDIAHATVGVWNRTSGQDGGQDLAEWVVAASPTVGGPTTRWGVFACEMNVSNCYADTGWSAKRSPLNNWTGVLQIVPENDDLRGGVATYNALYGIVSGPSGDNKADGIPAQVWNAWLMEPNAVCGDGYGVYASGNDTGTSARDPNAFLGLAQTWKVGLDLSSATFSDSDKAVVLKSGHKVQFGTGTYPSTISGNSTAATLSFSIEGAEALRLTRGGASAVNYLNVANAAASGQVVVSSAGADTNVVLALRSKGTDPIYLQPNSLTTLRLEAVSSQVNHWYAYGGATGNGPTLIPLGSDANIPANLQGRGTGPVRLLDGSSGTKVEVNTTGIGFHAATPIAKPTVTGSRGGNAALASLLTALANYGLITDSTTA